MLPPGCGFGTPEKPHSSLKEHDTLAPVMAVAFGQGQEIIVVAFCTFGILCMHGWYLAPMLIMIYGLGPIMGLKEGCISIGEPVRMPVSED